MKNLQRRRSLMEYKQIQYKPGIVRRNSELTKPWLARQELLSEILTGSPGGNEKGS
jgi:hypothetical protein